MSVVSTDFPHDIQYPNILSKVLHLFQEVPGSSHVLLLLTCLDCYVVANPWGKGLEYAGMCCKDEAQEAGICTWFTAVLYCKAIGYRS